MDHIRWQPGPWPTTIGLLALQLSLAQAQTPPERSGNNAPSCAGCSAPAAVPEALSGISYRGRLDSDATVFAVLMRNEREQIVGVGNILAEGWKVIAINTESVTLQHESSSLQRRLWLGGGVSRGEGPPVAEPAVQVSWKSPRRVELDGEFSVVLYLRGVEVRKGALTIDYDPAALRMVDASGQWEDNRGSTRLQVTDIGDGEDLVELAFRVIAQAPTSTRLRIRQIEFLDAGGAPIPQPSADDARIDIVAGSRDK